MINKDVFVRTVYEVMQAAGYKVTLTHAEQAIDSVLNTVVDELAAGGEVKLRNIGSLRTVYPKRTAQTWLPGARGKVVEFRPNVKFKASEALRKSIRTVEG